MLSKFRTLLKYACSRDVWDDVATRYQPKEQLEFISGKCRLFESHQFSANRLSYIGVSGAMIAVGYVSFYKLYHYSDRRWYGLTFYTLLFALILNRQLAFGQLFQKLVYSVDLTQCGRKVVVTYPNRLGLLKENQYDISLIQRPKDIDKNIHDMGYAFPVVFDKDLFYLARDQENILNKEILPVVMNGRYVYIQ